MHEQRHREQFTHPIASKWWNTPYFWIVLAGPILIYIGIIGDIWKPAIYALGLVTIPHVIIVQIFEIDAWIVGTYRYIKSKRGD
jgi:hypothetical protein